MKREVKLGVGLAGLILLLGYLLSGCTPAGKAMIERTLLGGLEFAAKMAERVLLSEAERALKFETSGGEE